ncbi:hypothetical protein FQA39_LY00485 [Lamprigera yunnana]|nr:hypothetical protein FQA39_LY00485 [Lamprigera yunnana]
MKMLLVAITAVVVLSAEAGEIGKPQAAVARTEIRVAKNLNPDEMQTLNVMTRDGNVAQLIVKRRDAKSKFGSPTRNAPTKDEPFYTAWNNGQPTYLKSENYGMVKNTTNEKPTRNNFGNANARLPYVPNPVNVRSGDIFVKPANSKKKGRSFMEIDSDGIPIVHGVRVPDDESDEKVWRNARVINGELVPYEKGYKPPAAVPLGELIFPSQASKSSGPYTTSDNFEKANGNTKASFGPYTVRDNHELDRPTESDDDYVKFSSSVGFGPFTIADNSRKLIDYIKEINAQEIKKDYFLRRKLRSHSTEHHPQIQRRMLEYTGTPSYPNSALYSSPSTKLSRVNFNEGVRTPILQYAHPEFGVQPAKASKEEEDSISEYDNKNKDNDIARNSYVKSSSSNNDLEYGGRYSPSSYFPTSSIDYYKNYPYNGLYLKPKTEQPFWLRLTESIKDNVQSGFDKMQQLTRPVFDPIVEATQKITHNLGLTNSPLRAQEKVGLITPMGSSIIIPALGLVAGGAALGLGAAAVGRFLQPEMRSLQKLNYPNDILLIMEESNNESVLNNNQRFRRSLPGNNEQQLQELSNVNNNDLQHLTLPYLWADTPCSKKLFCEVMIKQSPDDVLVMEKRMDSILSMVHPAVVETVSHHLQDVMNAVKKRNCNKFICRRYIPLA